MGAKMYHDIMRTYTLRRQAQLKWHPKIKSKSYFSIFIFAGTKSEEYRERGTGQKLKQKTYPSNLCRSKLFFFGQTTIKHIPTIWLHPTRTGALTVKAFVFLNETGIIMSSINKRDHPQCGMFLGINTKQSLTLLPAWNIRLYNPFKGFESRCSKALYSLLTLTYN